MPARATRSARAVGTEAPAPTGPGPDGYVLGASDPELRRLIGQSNMLSDATEDALRRAGIARGMHVLDVGAGVGGVSLLVARMVGPGGSVTALDNAPPMLEAIRARAAAHDLANVSVIEADLAAFTAERRYDAVVGRLILMHVDDPVAMLRRLGGALVADGVAFFAEFAMSFAGQRPAGPLFSETLERVQETFRRAGRPVDMGLELPRLLRTAGLGDPAAQIGGVLGEPHDPAVYRLLASTSRTLMPLSERLGVVEPGSVDEDTLERRLLAEAAEGDRIGVPPLLVSCWARRPEALRA